MPITAKIIHTAKQTVKAKVLASATDHCFACGGADAGWGAGESAVAMAGSVGKGKGKPRKTAANRANRAGPEKRKPRKARRIGRRSAFFLIYINTRRRPLLQRVGLYFVRGSDRRRAPRGLSSPVERGRERNENGAKTHGPRRIAASVDG
jgi:hypothetical protein